jgi:hypothetical protein
MLGAVPSSMSETLLLFTVIVMTVFVLLDSETVWLGPSLNSNWRIASVDYYFFLAKREDD